MILKTISLALLLLLIGLSVLPLAPEWNTVDAHGGHGQPGGGGSTAGTPLGPTPCVGGFAGPYPCARVDLVSFVPIGSLGGGRANDIWGWTDPLTQKEYALVGRTTGTSFVDISEPGAPVYLGTLPSHTAASTWRGIKVYADHAFIVSEATGHGLQVFDLTQLRSVETPPVTFAETAHYAQFTTAHTVALNEETGFLYAAGSNTCAGGLHIVDVRNPVTPTFAGCFSADRYTHETQCVVYRGPDLRYHGAEVCFNSNVDTLTIVDVTDKSAPVMLSRKGYPGRGYTHQGWLTPDHQHFLLDDEKDETNLQTNTRTHVWDVSDLTAPTVIGIYEGASTAIDHNLYIRGSHAFEANYRSGLRVLDATGIASASLREIGFFDVHPENDLPVYSGAWSNFPFFSSGLVAVSSIELGLFILRPNLRPISGADLIVSTLSVPSLGGAGMSLAVMHATENQGGAGAPASVTRFSLSTDATLDASDPVLGTHDVPALDGSIRHVATTTLTVPPGTTAGAYYIIADADNGSQAAEEIENNNVRPRFIQIGPDLRITAFTVPAAAVAGSTINVTDTTSNVGGANAADVITRLFLSRNTKIDSTDSELGVRFVPPLGPDDSHSATTAVSIPAGTAAGVYYVLGHVDRDNEVSEISEINNTASRKISVQ